MLRTLDIENIAVIEKASVNFSDGLNVLTGETGGSRIGRCGWITSFLRKK